jgi:5-methylthioribose kinase
MSNSDTTTWRSLRYTPADAAAPATLQVLDQLLLPHTVSYIDVPSVTAGWRVIHDMNIRGAPLIAIVAVLSLAVDLCGPTTQAELQQIVARNGGDSAATLAYIQGKMDYLATSRPTAVNLFHALAEVKTIMQQAAGDVASIVAAIVHYAEQMLQRDEADCRAIGEHGAQEILSLFPPDNNDDAQHKMTLLTICNTGSLATAHYGTALGVVRAVHAHGRLHQVVALETRPYNQGSRLTCFELLQDALPAATLICDSMAAAFLQRAERVVVVVGADRVVANGDTANKIGTYQLAVLAAHHGVPFYVAAPTTTLDANTASGADIVIEERPAMELLRSSQAPAHMPCWNPAFDVTPAKYITGIITERGVLRPGPDGTFNVPGFLQSVPTGSAAPDPPTTASIPPAVPTTIPPAVPEEETSYVEQTVATLPAFVVAHVPDAVQRLQTDRAEDLDCVEMGDGNLNLVFLVSNRQHPDRAVIVKQALPYVRCVGESWPLTLDRAFFEYSALTAHKKACPSLVPRVFYFSHPHALMVMEYLAPPLQILRSGLIQGLRYPTLAEDLGTYCAHTLFRTSGFGLAATALREQVEFWTRNRSLCGLTEQVIFTEPYQEASNNRWTRPYLDADKQAIEGDVALQVAAARWKQAFVTRTEALIHGDLHTGSVMCAAGQTFVIDPEFAFYGPMAFDTGALVANLLLAYVSQKGHRAEGDDTYEEWILQQVVGFWNTFRDQFIALWNDPQEHRGFMYHTLKEELALAVQSPDRAPVAWQQEHLRTLLQETLGFAGMKMLRRIVGIAHVQDLESIPDLELRSRCERRALRMARVFIVQESPDAFGTIEDVIALVRATPF